MPLRQAHLNIIKRLETEVLLFVGSVCIVVVVVQACIISLGRDAHSNWIHFLPGVSMILAFHMPDYCHDNASL